MLTKIPAKCNNDTKIERLLSPPTPLYNLMNPQQNDNSDIPTTPRVEQLQQKTVVDYKRQPQHDSFLNCDHIPIHIVAPFDAPSVTIALRDMYNSEIRHQDLFQLKDIDNYKKFYSDALNLLIKCHGALKLRESVLFLACQMLHRICLQMKPEWNGHMGKIACQVLFTAQKYFEPMNAIPCRNILIGLYGLHTSVRSEEIIQLEWQFLQNNQFCVETMTPYSYMNIFYEILSLSQHQYCLICYLTTLSMCDIEHHHYRPSQLAASIISVSLKQYGALYDHNMVYWSSYSQKELHETNAYIRRIWGESFQRGLNKCPCQCYKKYSDVRRFEVALEEPRV